MTDIVERLTRGDIHQAGRDLIARCFGNKSVVIASIPARPDVDADLVLMGGLMKAAEEIERLRSIVALLRADLCRNADTVDGCESCGAPLFGEDEFVSDPDGAKGCWRAMTDVPSERKRPCYDYRVARDHSAGARDKGDA